jgi:hypothetical protein
MSVFGALIGCFGLFVLALILGFGSARADDRISLKWPRVWRPIVTLYVCFGILGGLMVFATYWTGGMRTAAGLEMVSIGLMFIAATMSLLMGYAEGARKVDPGWWQKVHLDVPLHAVRAAPENASPEATPHKEAR